ncbi:hypothetical protein PR202_ga20110 [Eleusine coracana subsp. coracana]|uniref:Endoplasmic reticulum vesicle transporter protein n=1 Tax=Eleusine coracana subsp. coracana TaxID=191504 RepID=A0AAV5CVS3_ELECO|nr:hypothetical protein PR202_ga20110 [Eleusine coracana subsp. coracana]
MDGLLSKLRSLDAYPKVNEDFYSRTLSGGIITLASSIVMLLLFVSELRTPLAPRFPPPFALAPPRSRTGYAVSGLYLHAVTETTLRVDTSRGEQLRINFDVTFPALQCSIISLDAMDISGLEHLDVKHDIFKQRIDAHGNVIATRQDAVGGMKSDGQCCNTCEDVREAYRKKGWGVSNPDLLDQCKREGFLQSIKDEEGEGCNIYGFIEVNKVAGNFHFAPGKSFQQSNVHVHDLLPFQKDSFNVSHRINKLSFGESFPGVVNPLDGAHWVQHSSYGMYQYFIKVVPTVYTGINERIILSNQVTFTEQHVSFLHFLTNVCAIVGDYGLSRPVSLSKM